jgi:cobalamin biosynthesis protein CbiG
MTTRNEKAIIGDALRRLAAIEGLIRLSHVAVGLKAGDSAKLHRAEDDLRAALEGLEIVQDDLRDLATAKAAAAADARRIVYKGLAKNALFLGQRGA